MESAARAPASPARNLRRDPEGRLRVPLVQLVATRGAIEALRQDEILLALSLHASGEWGELGDEDKQANDAALRDGTRILSAYTFRNIRVWVITEGDRSCTTVLRPEDY